MDFCWDFEPASELDWNYCARLAYCLEAEITPLMTVLSCDAPRSFILRLPPLSKLSISACWIIMALCDYWEASFWINALFCYWDPLAIRCFRLELGLRADPFFASFLLMILLLLFDCLLFVLSIFNWSDIRLSLGMNLLALSPKPSGATPCWGGPPNIESFLSEFIY